MPVKKKKKASKDADQDKPLQNPVIKDAEKSTDNSTKKEAKETNDNLMAYLPGLGNANDAEDDNKVSFDYTYISNTPLFSDCKSTSP